MALDASETHDHDYSQHCLICGLNTPFDLPNDLVDAALEGSLVLFAGAGVSTEVPAVFPSTIYTTIKESVQCSDNADFPAVMSAYVSKFGKAKLIEEVWNRFDYIRSFRELRRRATRFHRELATMPYIREIITTNWDSYFEDECGAIPIVSGADYALSAIKRRRVYKIHGSINSISTIVATEEDYERCLRDLAGSALGGTLRHLLSTKTVVFVGYSLTDDDFTSIYDVLTSDLGSFGPKRYFVGPFQSSEASRLEMDQIVTDGTYFLSMLKRRVIETSYYLPDSIYDAIELYRVDLMVAREKVDQYQHIARPEILYCYFYQEGARDACDRVAANRMTGEYSNEHSVHHKVQDYMTLRDKATEKERFPDVAYIEGYLNCLLLILYVGEVGEGWQGSVALPPPFFCFTRRGLYDATDFDAAARNLRRRNRPAWDLVKKISADCGDGYVPQHGQFLDLDGIMA